MSRNKMVLLVSRRIHKKNKLRNIIITIAIAMTSMLLSILFEVTLTTSSMLEKEALKEVGTVAEGAYKDITSEEYNLLSNYGTFYDLSYDVYAGICINSEFDGDVIEVRYIEPKAAGWNFCSLVEGEFPQAQYDVVVDDILLKLLGNKSAVGDKIQLSIQVGDQVITHVFLISGIYEANHVSGVSQVYVSDKFINELVFGIRSEDEWKLLCEEGNSNGVGLRCAFCRLNGDINGWESDLENNWYDSGIERTPSIAVNWAYANNSFSVGTFCFVFVVAMLILCSCYLIVYNIFYISVVNDVRLYGQLKLLGMVNSQIKAILYKQAFKLYIIGMPIGIVLGYVVGRLVIPMVMLLGNFDYESANGFSLAGTIFCAFFTAITVMISTGRPIKILYTLSPISGAKFSGIGLNKLNSRRKPLKSKKIYKRNIERNKKRNRLVSVSIILTMMLFVVSDTLVNSISFDDFLKIGTPSDVFISSKEFLSDSEVVDLGESVYSELNNRLLDETVSPLYYQNTIHIENEDDVAQTQFATENRYYLDVNTIDKFDIVEGEFDYTKWSTGDYVIIMNGMEESEEDIKYHSGDTIELQTISEDTQAQKNSDGSIEWKNLSRKEYKVMAVVEYFYSLSIRIDSQNEINTILPIDQIKENGATPTLFAICIDEKNDDTNYDIIEKYIDEIDENLIVKTVLDVENEFMEFSGVVKTLLGFLTLTIALMAIMNLINNEITCIKERELELHTMWKIGMTTGQCIKMLRIECIAVVMRAGLIGLVLGELLCAIGFGIAEQSFAWISYSFSLILPLCLFAILLTLSVMLPWVVYRRMVIMKMK